MEPDMLLYLLVLGMLLELRQALDLVKMLPLLLSLENLHLDLWNQAKVTSESTYGAGRRDAGMALDHEGICLSIRLR